MPWHRKATKDVVWLRKASVSCQTSFDPGMSEWGNLPYFGRALRKESERRELKNLSTCRKRNQIRDFLSSASEKEIA